VLRLGVLTSSPVMRKQGDAEAT